MKTKTEAIWPILGCLEKARDFLKTDKNYIPVNNEQKTFLEDFWKWNRDLKKVPVESRADFNSSVINEWLKEKGFDIHLDPVCSPEFAVASVLDALVIWKKKGNPCKLEGRDGKTYDGVRLDSGFQIFYTPETGKFVQIQTKSGETVCMAFHDNYTELDQFGLTKYAMKINDTMIPDSSNPSSVTFPMINCDQKVDITFLKGMSLDGFNIGEAFQQTRFRMNEEGARAESAVAMGFRGMILCNPYWFEINAPFILWINSPKTKYPIFTGYFAQDTWEKPKGLQ